MSGMDMKATTSSGYSRLNSIGGYTDLNLANSSSGKYGYGKKNAWIAIVIRYVRTIFLYGWLTNSLGLTSDAVHMLFDSTALIFSLIASVIAKWEANEYFTYGYGRVETLTGFANALALVFASLGIIWEGVERMFDPPALKTDSLLTVSVLGLLVNLVGIFAFDHGGMHHHGHDHGHGGHSHGGHSHSEPSHGHSHGGHDHGGHGGHDDHYGHDHDDHDDHHGHCGHDHGSMAGMFSMAFLTGKGVNPLLHGMFLHVLSDTLGSVGVIISSLLVKYYGLTWTDPFVSLVIAGLTLVSIWPLLKGSSYTLLQRIPDSLAGITTEAYRKISVMEGVSGFSNPHFWELCQGKNVGSIKVQINDRANEERVRAQISNLFRELGVTDMVIQMERDVVLNY
ncbi:hypothetical protein HDU76_007779 [Blyttiomyces sp. JEL0837]|nr:hypothetical protein HDU76_007779 [Blyttiomyces sp. JEL0837]